MSKKKSHRPLSQAQLDANRANAAKSTGPKTPAGKVRSSMNAWKHGITARCVVLTHENKAEFEALAFAYRNRFLPADELEVLVLDQIIIVHWHMDRLRTVQSIHIEQEIYNPDCCAFYPDVVPEIDTHAIPAIAYRNLVEKSRIIDVAGKELTRLSREFARLNQVFLDIRRNIPVNDSGIEPAATPLPEAPQETPAQNEAKLPPPFPAGLGTLARSIRLISKEVTPDIRPIDIVRAAA